MIPYYYRVMIMNGLGYVFTLEIPSCYCSCILFRDEDVASRMERDNGIQYVDRLFMRVFITKHNYLCKQALGVISRFCRSTALVPFVWYEVDAGQSADPARRSFSCKVSSVDTRRSGMFLSNPRRRTSAPSHSHSSSAAGGT